MLTPVSLFPMTRLAAALTVIASLAATASPADARLRRVTTGSPGPSQQPTTPSPGSSTGRVTGIPAVTTNAGPKPLHMGDRFGTTGTYNKHGLCNRHPGGNCYVPRH